MPCKDCNDSGVVRAGVVVRLCRCGAAGSDAARAQTDLELVTALRRRAEAAEDGLAVANRMVEEAHAVVLSASEELTALRIRAEAAELELASMKAAAAETTRDPLPLRKGGK